jgi:hypothetical protein
MFRSLGHQQAIFTKLKIRYMQYKEHLSNMGRHKTYKCIKVYKTI